MRNYDRINALPPKGIEDMSAHIIGGGIAGLAAAAFLVTDAHMPPGNVTVYETLSVLGGSMDAAGDAQGCLVRLFSGGSGIPSGANV